MTLAEFDKKWKNIPIGHGPRCEKRDGFDYEICTCGHDELWRRRNEDLRTVPAAELEAFRRSLLHGKTQTAS